MRILLDTNVILTGALNPLGPSAQLQRIREKSTFLVSERVMRECVWNISKASPNAIVEGFARQAVEGYLGGLGAIQIEDTKCVSAICDDPDDQIIYETAQSSRCTYVCTYNVRDFPAGDVKAKTPLAILRDSQDIKQEDLGKPIEDSNMFLHIQYPLLGRSGTLLVIGQIMDRASVGKILTSQAVQLFVDKDGYIQIEGDGVANQKSNIPIDEVGISALVIRYKPGNLEVTRWRPSEWFDSGQNWSKEVLATANCEVSADVRTSLIFEKGNRLRGYIWNISGIPRYMKEKNIIHVLSSGSLEAAAGSLDLKFVLNSAVVHKLNRGYMVTLPTSGRMA